MNILLSFVVAVVIGVVGLPYIFESVSYICTAKNAFFHFFHLAPHGNLGFFFVCTHSMPKIAFKVSVAFV